MLLITKIEIWMVRDPCNLPSFGNKYKTNWMKHINLEVEITSKINIERWVLFLGMFDCQAVFILLKLIFD